MKKLITLILVLTGMVSTASADDPKTATVYVKAGSCPNIHIWNTGDGGTSTTWGTNGDNLPLMTETNLYGVTVYKYDVTYFTDSFKCLFKWGTGTQSKDVEGIDGDAYYTWDGNWTDPTTYDHSISSVQLIGGTLTTQSLTLDNGVYSGSIDLSSTMLDKSFKVVVTLGSGDRGWLGWNANTLTKTDNGSLLSSAGGDGDDFVIDNKSYKTYNVSVSFTNPTTWALNFAGDETRGNTPYTFTVKNDAGWSTVQAYTFAPDGDNQTGSWDSAETMIDNGNGTWTLTKTLYEPYPQKVIFKDAGTNQTKNLYLTNGYTAYTNQPYAATKYYVVGNIPEFANFDQSRNLAEMTATTDGSSRPIHTFDATDVALSGNVEYKIVAKDYAKESDPAWYPNSNKEISISENGKYDLSIVFNDYWGDKGLETVSSYTSTLKSIPATTVGGYGTFSSATHDLDFSSASLTAYTATSAADGLVHMEPVTGKVPAATGLFLVGATEYIPVTTDASSVGTNLLHPTTGGDIYNSSKFQYVLGNQSGIAFYKVGGSLSPAAGKAYLETDAAAANNARLAFIFDDDENTTGIVNNKREVTAIDGYYNLNGQRVANPTKGLYIVNGKKVIIK